MKFREAFLAMKDGKKIRLPGWKGYWIWDNNTIMIHCHDYLVLDIRETPDVSFTFSFICSEEWIVVEE